MVRNILMRYGVDVYTFMANWKIQFYPLAQTNPKYFDHFVTTSGQKINPNMPSGATGKNVVTLWLHDSTNEFKDRENSDRVMHELCHAMLLDKYGTRGEINWVTAVHKNQDMRFHFNFWYWKTPFWRRFPISAIEIRNFL